MKTFINVLYRRILYKIPLKLLLILLVLFGLLFLGFSNANYSLPLLNWEGNYYLEDGAFRYSRDVVSFTTSSQLVSLSNEYNFFCFRTASNNSSDWSSYSLDNNSWVSSPGNQYFCTDDHTVYFRCTTNGCQINFYYYKDGEGFIPKQYDSLQCQTVYNLIPIESVDQNYCESNNLCPSQQCPVCPVGTGNLTQLYINNVLHIGAPTILMDIPDEIDWDYEYTMGGNVMNIDIVGYNVDYDKINEQINLQNFKPSSEDLSKVVSGIIPLFVPGLCIILLLYFIFKFIKKIF